MRRRGCPRLRFGLLFDPLGKNDHVPIGIKHRKLAHAVKSLVQRYFNLDLVLLHALKKVIKTFQFYVQADTAGPRLAAGPVLIEPVLIEKDLYIAGSNGNKNKRLLLWYGQPALETKGFLIELQACAYVLDHQIGCDFLVWHSSSCILAAARIVWKMIKHTPSVCPHLLHPRSLRGRT